jgi:TM2 domain-containing membrane protein YozV
VAALMSVFVPGLGKLYAGKTRAFFTTLILNAAYAAQTLESNRKLGTTSVLTIINASAFTTFYLSNIYGSFKAVQQRKKEFKKQFLTDATLHYN